MTLTFRALLGACAVGALCSAAAAETTITQDPMVRELLQQFKTARIVPGSIKPV